MSHTYSISLASLRSKLKKEVQRTPLVRDKESFIQFRFEDGTEFYYDNYNNGVYNSRKEPLSEPTEPDAFYESVNGEVRTRSKSNKPFWIRVLLGHACNYDCSYCMQKDIGNPDEREKITTVETFIEQIKRLDLSRLEKIDLWGGETLLYWKTMEVLMREFDREGLTWFIPTNGTPLQMKHVEFFKTLKGTVSIGLSHDGPGQERLRGEEFLHKKVEILKEAQKYSNIQFSFNPVLSHTNYDLYEINKFFYDYCTENGIDIRKTAISWTVGHNHDGGSSHHVIHGESLAKFKDIIKRFIDDSIEQRFNGVDHKLMNNSLIESHLGVLPYTKTLRKQILPTYITSCGVDDSGVLSVDMKGNVRTCPHTDESFIGGHIDELENVSLARVDLDRYERHCRSCEVFRLCKSNCPIEVPDEVFYTNCAIEKVYHKAIQNKAFEMIFNKKLDQR
jgi:uncharacterized protein